MSWKSIQYNTIYILFFFYIYNIKKTSSIVRSWDWICGCLVGWRKQKRDWAHAKKGTSIAVTLKGNWSLENRIPRTQSDLHTLPLSPTMFFRVSVGRGEEFYKWSGTRISVSGFSRMKVRSWLVYIQRIFPQHPIALKLPPNDHSSSSLYSRIFNHYPSFFLSLLFIHFFLFTLI